MYRNGLKIPILSILKEWLLYLFFLLMPVKFQENEENMKRYKDKLQEYFKKILDFKGYSIYDTNHSVSQYNIRVGKNIFLYEKLLKKGILHLIKINKSEQPDNYIFVSKKYDFGIQIDWRQDKYTGKFGGYTATTLSGKEMKFFTKNDTQLFLEQIQKEGIKNVLTEEIIHDIDLNEISYFRLNHNNKDMTGYDVFIEDGNIYRTFEIIKVEI